MRKRWIVVGAFALAIGVLAISNASFWGRPRGDLTLLAHRGVHQDYSRQGLTDDTCTATRIYAPSHAFIENTLPSMTAAFDAGADIVEIDIHPTTDGEFAVFHDWTLDCRTDGRGVTREHSMTELRALDLGHGYTADGGRTFPLRGRGIGMMPTLREVLAAFPQRRFLINFKGGDPGEADLLVRYLDATPEAELTRLAFYGASPADRLQELRPDLQTLSRRRLMRCAKTYLLTGWYGNVDAACRNTIIFVPSNLGWMAWGWPNLFLQRMQNVGTDVYIAGALRRGERPGVGGIDDAESLSRIPRGWRGGLTTDRIEIIGPLISHSRS